MCCISKYLKYGLIEVKQINLNERKILEQTNKEFVEFITEKIEDKTILCDKKYNKKEIFEMCLNEYTEYNKDNNKYFKQDKFTDCLKIYAKHTENIEEFKESKSNKNRFFEFISKKI